MKFKFIIWQLLNVMFWSILLIILYSFVHESIALLIGTLIIILLFIQTQPIRGLSFSFLEKSITTNMEDVGVYKNLMSVNECIYDGYGKDINHWSSDYYYDYMDINIIDKKLSFLELKSFLKNRDYNLLYDSESKLYIKTKKMHLDGVLRTSIKDGQSMYSIGDYRLHEDEEQKICSLANNQNIKLDIIYNKDTLHDNYIQDYIIINAETVE